MQQKAAKETEEGDIPDLTKEDPGLYNVDIYIGDKIISSVSTQANSKQLAGMFALQQIKIKINKAPRPEKEAEENGHNT